MAGKNNIFYDNTSTSQPNLSGSATMTYSDIGGGWSGTGNIDASPIFIMSPTLGYCLLSQIAAGQTVNSPCVNAGDPGTTPVIGTTRTDHVQDSGINDMGFHWPISVTLAGNFGRLMTAAEPVAETQPSALPSSLEVRLTNAPNPFNPTTIITLTLGQAASVDLKVYDLAGRVVANLFQGSLAAGAHPFQFSGENLPAGVYVYRAEVSGNVVTGKALLVK